MVSVFIALGDTFIESGTTNALIRKLDRNDLDFSTALFCNLILSTIAYAILFISSRSIASFYQEDSIILILRCLGLNLFIYSLCIVPNAILISSFHTKSQAKINFVANATGGGIAVISAYHGCGVWALVIQSILANLLKAIGYWLSVKWHPSLAISQASLQYLWNYGSKSLAIGILGTLFNNIYNLLIGKFFTKQDLGYYTRGNQFVQMPSGIIQSSFQKVSVATLANLQDDIPKLKIVYRKYIHVLSFISFPLFFLLATIAEPLIIFLITEKWKASILILQILSIGAAFSPLGIINLCLLQAINKIDYSLKLEIIKKIVYLVIICISFPIGLIPMVIGASFYNIVGTGMNFSCSKKFLGYTYLEQLKDISAYLFVSIIVASIIFNLIMPVITSLVLKILISSFLFVILYFGICYILQLKALKDIFELKTKLKS